ncbi:MAG: hypothetical protein JXA45_04665 [Methanomassiliicoccales archaeon]|nr:hypothetical protein [Methanomassiliicoccales archaeon]
MDKFTQDLQVLMVKLLAGCDPSQEEALRGLEQRLVDLKEKNLLKINHSVLEMIVAKYLVMDGYDVDLEHMIDAGLSCDVYARKGEGVLIVEVETGYVPPAHALDPMDYIRARIASKIARYSNHCHKFSLAAPPHYVMPVMSFFTRPPRDRPPEEVEVVKRYCDLYYKSPPVSMDEIMNSRIHSVSIIDVENAVLSDMSPDEYINLSADWYL